MGSTKAKAKVKETIKAKPIWFRKKPKEEMQKPKFWNKSWWYYCSPETGGNCPGRWWIHKSKDCKSEPPTDKGGED